MNGIARHWCLPSRTRTSFRSLGSIGSKWTLVAKGVDVATDQRRRDSRAENISARFQRPLLARWLTRWFQKKILFPSRPITSRRQGFLLSSPAAHPFSLSLTLRSSSTRLSSARLTTVMRSQGNLPGVCYLGRKFDTIGARHKTDFRIGWSHCRRTGHFYRGKGAGTQQLVPRRRAAASKPTCYGEAAVVFSAAAGDAGPENTPRLFSPSRRRFSVPDRGGFAARPDL